MSARPLAAHRVRLQARLTQEVAYKSLIIESRTKLHERSGRALEAIFATQLDGHLTQLAHHYN